MGSTHRLRWDDPVANRDAGLIRRLWKRLRFELIHEHIGSSTIYAAGTELPDDHVYQEWRCACGKLMGQVIVRRTPGMRVVGIR